MSGTLNADFDYHVLGVQGDTEGPFVRQLLQQVLLPLGLSAAMLWFVVKNGKRMVNQPRLRPDLSQPW